MVGARALGLQGGEGDQGLRWGQSFSSVKWKIPEKDDGESFTTMWLFCYWTVQWNMVKMKERKWSCSIQFSSVQSLSHVWLSATPWIAAHQASLSITNSRSSLKLTSIESIMPSSHLILCCPLLFLPPIPPSIWVFSNESTLRMSIGVSALASFLPKKSQGWSPSEWTGWISLQSKGLSRIFSNNTVQKHQFFGAQPSSQSNFDIHTWPQEKPQPWLDRPLLAK